MSDSRDTLPKLDAFSTTLEGIDFIIVPYRKHENKPMLDSENLPILKQLEICVASAGLPGTVAFVWPLNNGRVGYFPSDSLPLRTFTLKNSYQEIEERCNRKIPCTF